MNSSSKIVLYFIFIIVLILSFCVFSGFIQKRRILNLSEFWTDMGMYLAHPGKIFNAKLDVPVEKRLLQQPTKCFSCERQMLKLDPSKLYLAGPTKCFDCEKQLLAYNS
jgi:hypothetical protein